MGDIAIKVRLPLLHIASSKGKYLIATKLIEYGANINETDRYGTTAMHWAATSGQIKIIRLLLHHQANINKCDILDMTPLHSAAHSGRVKTTKYLLRNGADPSIVSIHNHSALDLAKNQNNAKCVKLLTGVQSVEHLFEQKNDSKNKHPKIGRSNTLNRCLSVNDDEISDLSADEMITLLSPKKKQQKSMKLQHESLNLFKNMESFQLNVESLQKEHDRIKKKQSLMNNKEQRRESLVVSKYNIDADKLRKQLFYKAKHVQTDVNKSKSTKKYKKQRHSSFDGYLDSFANTKHDDLMNRFQILQGMQKVQASKTRRYSQIGL